MTEKVRKRIYNDSYKEELKPNNLGSHKRLVANYGENRKGMTIYESEDYLTTLVESLMLRGVVDEIEIKNYLNLANVRTVRSCVQRVHNRWTVMGAKQNRDRLKGSIIGKLNQVQAESWRMLSSGGVSNNQKMKILKEITAMVKLESEILGVKEVSPVINNNYSDNRSVNNNTSISIREEGQVREAAVELLQLLGAEG